MYRKICLYVPSPAPPLTVGNILKALEGVKDWKRVAEWLAIDAYYTSSISSLKEAVEKFLKGHGHFQPSWRAVIFALDVAEETPVANHIIRSYGEPVQGRYTYMHQVKMHVYHHNSV